MSEQVAVVTGAGSGVGRAAALALLDAGWQVVLAGRRAAPLEGTAALAKAGAALIIPADVTDPDSVETLFGRAASELGRIDVLFNNAGGNVPSTNFGDLTWEQWKTVTAVNLDGMFLCASAAFRRMRDQTPQGGRIINNGSISAHTPRPGSAPYTATKHATTGLTKSISLDGRAFNIACGQIDIGNALTEFSSGMTRGVKQAGGAIATEPMMDVEQVAQAVVQMAALPLEANILFMTIMATRMPFVGRG